MTTETYKALIESFTKERAIELDTQDVSVAFESIANTLILEGYDLGIDDIEAGVTDGGGDGQIDAMYVIVNGVAVTSAELDEIPQKGPIELDLLFIQSKYTDSFEENPLRSMRNTINDLLNLTAEYNGYMPNYNEAVQDKFQLARGAIISSAGRTAEIRARVFYATKAGTSNIHSNVVAAAEALKADLSKSASTSDVEVYFLGAEELITKSRQTKTLTRTLEIKDSISSDDGDSYACLVTIGSFISFLTDNGVLLRALFDANVRDFLGKNTEVNAAMRLTLSSIDKEDFWWFNNGVTLVASETDLKGKKLVLTEPLLVNGLQTSNVIYSIMSDGSISQEIKDRCVNKLLLIKIVVPPDERIRDEIVKATNSQANIPKPYLRGMDIVHRNIEDHLKSLGLFYERRKNQYKNAGKKRSSIITLTEAAQALMAALLFRGDYARARPTTLLQTESDYQKLYSESYHLDTYKNIILTKRAIMVELSAMYGSKGTSFRNDVIHHVLAFLAEKSFHSTAHAASGWKSAELGSDALKNAIQVVVKLFEDMGGTDKVAKSSEFKTAVSSVAVAARSVAKV